MGQDIADAIDYGNYHNHPCLIFIADFEKVFDMVKWKKNFFKTFGDMTTLWI